jgi:dihydrofolate reductase
MSRLIASINVTIDGFCDHTAVIADDELHINANELLDSVSTVLFGRVTYQLFEDFWPLIAKENNYTAPVNEFAHKIDAIDKVVFSSTMEHTDWQHTRIIKEPMVATIKKMKQVYDKDLLLCGSPGLLNSMIEHKLVDEYQLWIQPVFLGNGRRLFNDIHEQMNVRLLKTKTLKSGVVVLYYKPL